MQLIERKPKVPHDMGHDREHEARDVGCEQRVERPPDPVVVEHACVFSAHADVGRRMPGRPFAESVDRLARQEDVTHKKEDRPRRPDTDAAILLGQGDLEQLLELRAVKQCIDDRQRASRR